MALSVGPGELKTETVEEFISISDGQVCVRLFFFDQVTVVTAVNSLPRHMPGSWVTDGICRPANNNTLHQQCTVSSESITIKQLHLNSSMSYSAAAAAAVTRWS